MGIFGSPESRKKKGRELHALVNLYFANLNRFEVVCMSGFNYSKWDNIELSDDEDDLHPNIDKESWFRMKHRSRLEREEREDQEVKQIEKINNEDAARMKIIIARLNAIESLKKKKDADNDDAEFDDEDALKIELSELKSNTSLRLKRVEDIKERRKWNIDNICKTSEDRTIVNKKESAPSLKADDFKPTGLTAKAIEENKATKAIKVAEKVAVPPVTQSEAHEPKVVTSTKSIPPTTHISSGPKEHSEKDSVLSYNDYVLEHENLLETYSELADMEKTKDFLFKHCDVLLHEHSQSYMLLSCLEDEMNGKHKRMKLVCRQSQILSHIQELGISMRRDPRDVVLPFFARIDEKEYFKAFIEQVDAFEKRIKERAVVKRKEMDAERRQEQREGVPVGPGGLDPFEVLESLPAPMRKAFDSQDIGQLQAVLSAMPPAEAKLWLNKCIDSGLWVPGGNGDAEDEEESGSKAEAARLAQELDPID